MMMYEEYERPEDWFDMSTKERLDHIVERLSFISQQQVYKDIRSRYASKEQNEEEFGPEYEKLISDLWFSAKEDYSQNKYEYDGYIVNNPQSKGYMNNLEAMRKVIDEEIDNLLLDDETDSIDN